MDATQKTPEPPPEALLIKETLKDRRLSARKAAIRAGVSDTWFRNILRGYQPVGGTYSAVKASAEMLADVANVLGLTPLQLREVDREDAAEELEWRARRAAPPTPASPPAYATDPRVEAITTLLNHLPPEAQAEVLRRFSHANPQPQREETPEVQPRRAG
jgi:transcriptional regulator with XRE-family HTH domain